VHLPLPSRRKHTRRLRLALTALFTTSGCLVNISDVAEGRACDDADPCRAGLACVDGRCRYPTSDGGVDSGTDAGDSDAGTGDSGVPDSGQPDSGQPDGGQPDSGNLPDASYLDGGPNPDAGGLTLFTGIDQAMLAQAGDPIEAGLRFRSRSPGWLIAARFFKGSAQNAGPHVAHLWSSAGTLIASANFAAETGYGWQQVQFEPAVPLAANTFYVLSYFAPAGHVTVTPSAFSSGEVGTPPLFAPKDGDEGPNGCVSTSADGGFPSTAAQGANYWVDPVFTPTYPGSTVSVFTNQLPAASFMDVPSWLGFRFYSDIDGVITGVRFYKAGGDLHNAHTAALWTVTGTRLAVGFSRSETGSGWQDIPFDEPVRIGANVRYVAAYLNASGVYVGSPNFFTLGGVDNPPLHAPVDSATEHNGLYRNGGTTVDVPINTFNGNNYFVDVRFSTTPPLTVRGNNGPILVITDSARPFTRYLEEILRGEGLVAFASADVDYVTPELLSGYDVVLLGDTPLVSSLVAPLTTWVQAGGRLVTMRPASALSALAGVSSTAGVLNDRYLKVDPTGPGSGIVSDTIQYHGQADLNVLSPGTAVLATLFSTADAGTTYPAVFSRAVGDGGQVVSFAYDLARSVVYQRQGNPTWEIQDRDQALDGGTGLRSNDLFFGGALFDPQPDWVDLSRVQIPQADEQQRLLANLLVTMSRDRTLLPRLWYFPFNKKSAVVLSSDDHGNNGTQARFELLRQMAPANCTVDDWQCARATSFVYPETVAASIPLTDAIAKSYVDMGFEIGDHVQIGCGAPMSTGALMAGYVVSLNNWAVSYPSLPRPATHRMHCIAWPDWASQPHVEIANGMRLDTSYYYYPADWLVSRDGGSDHPGFMTGSGMPQRFVDKDGLGIDVYQAATQMTDESGQFYPETIQSLIANTREPPDGPGYYGVFTANMHADQAGAGYPSQIGAIEIATIAIDAGVPVVTAKQMLDWLDARNGTGFGPMRMRPNGSASRLRFPLTTSARGLTLFFPWATATGKTLQSVTRDGAPVPLLGPSVVKGQSYGVVLNATSGNYEATYP
jgi:hypothetical protein